MISIPARRGFRLLRGLLLRARTGTFWLFLYSFAIISASQAAEIRLSKSRDSQIPIITIEGPLELGDEKKFVAQVINLENGLVLFNSPGGNLLAGIEIGKAIRLKNLSTAVASRGICASSCALAWLGGTRRFLFTGSLVGFHAAYKEVSGVPAETGLGNAIVGAYLNSLGLPVNAVAYITHASPNQMQWLTESDAQRYGIHYTMLADSQSQAAAPRESARSSSTNTAIERHQPQQNDTPRTRETTTTTTPPGGKLPQCPSDRGAYWHNCIGQGGGTQALSSYFGEYRNNLRDGQGVCTSPDGSNKINGIWKAGKLQRIVSFGSNSNNSNSDLDCNQWTSWGPRMK
jgi:hypothetical protein